MTHLPYATCLRLKEAGFPQPQPAPNQIWWIGSFVGFEAEYWELYLLGAGGVMENAVFCPSIEYITAHLSPGFRLEMWDGKFSGHNGDDAQLIRTFGENFAEAAALMYLEYKKILGFLG